MQEFRYVNFNRLMTSFGQKIFELARSFRHIRTYDYQGPMWRNNMFLTGLENSAWRYARPDRYERGGGSVYKLLPCLFGQENSHYEYFDVLVRTSIHNAYFPRAVFQ